MNAFWQGFEKRAARSASMKGIKALNKGNSANQAMTARPTTMQATVGSVNAPKLPSVTPKQVSPADPVPKVPAQARPNARPSGVKQPSVKPPTQRARGVGESAI